MTRGSCTLGDGQGQHLWESWLNYPTLVSPKEPKYDSMLLQAGGPWCYRPLTATQNNMLVFKVQEVNPKHCGLVVEMAGEPPGVREEWSPDFGLCFV